MHILPSEPNNPTGQPSAQLANQDTSFFTQFKQAANGTVVPLSGNNGSGFFGLFGKSASATSAPPPGTNINTPGSAGSPAANPHPHSVSSLAAKHDPLDVSF
jgi:hypothetical protein